MHALTERLRVTGLFAVWDRVIAKQNYELRDSKLLFRIVAQ